MKCANDLKEKESKSLKKIGTPPIFRSYPPHTKIFGVGGIQI